MKSDDGIVKTACASSEEDGDFVTLLKSRLRTDDYAFLVVLASPVVDLDAFLPALSATIPCDLIIGARTAGEICSVGYCEGTVVLLGFPKSHFAATAKLIDLDNENYDLMFSSKILQMRQDVQVQRPDFDQEFAMLMVDGLSLQEDALVFHIHTALGSTPLIGGSSGDGLTFANAPVIFNGTYHSSAAVLLIARSNCGVKIFSEDHFHPSPKRLIVTGANPEERLVTEINGTDAALEYARLVGIDPKQLSTFVFSAHPVLVSIGDQHHVRSIQQVEDNKYLRFFSAIDEGMVLTLASADNIASHLEGVLDGLSQTQNPDLIFACDCFFRRIEAEERQEINNMSALFRKHKVFGFSTYGEQHNMLHVNQTFTGMAIYPPKM